MYVIVWKYSVRHPSIQVTQEQDEPKALFSTSILVTVIEDLYNSPCNLLRLQLSLAYMIRNAYANTEWFFG